MTDRLKTVVVPATEAEIAAFDRWWRACQAPYLKSRAEAVRALMAMAAGGAVNLPVAANG